MLTYKHNHNGGGLQQALDNSFALHNLGHANPLGQFGQIVHPDGAEVIRGLSRRAAAS